MCLSRLRLLSIIFFLFFYNLYSSSSSLSLSLSLFLFFISEVILLVFFYNGTGFILRLLYLTSILVSSKWSISSFFGYSMIFISLILLSFFLFFFYLLSSLLLPLLLLFSLFFFFRNYSFKVYTYRYFPLQLFTNLARISEKVLSKGSTFCFLRNSFSCFWVSEYETLFFLSLKFI